MIIDIVSDVVCPWCYIGKRRFERALADRPQAQAQIGWRPFQLNPELPPDGMDRKDYLRAKFGDAGGGRRYEAVEAAGAGEGIPFRFDLIRRTPNTVLAHRLIRHAATLERQDAVVDRLFRGYFTEGADIGRPDTLADLAEEAGLDRPAVSRFLGGDGEREQVLAEDRYARELGIDGVPCFIFERKLAVSGAQAPEVFHQVLDRVAAEATA